MNARREDRNPSSFPLGVLCAVLLLAPEGELLLAQRIAVPAARSRPRIRLLTAAAPNRHRIGAARVSKRLWRKQ